MELSITHKTLDEIPEAHRELYSERDGAYHLTGVAGVKTQDDITRLTTALEKERNEHRDTKGRLKPWDGLEPDDVRGKLDRFQELEIAAKGNKDEMDSKLEDLTEARVRTRLAPVERQNTELQKKYEEMEAQYNVMLKEKTQRTISDAVRSAAQEGMKVLDTAMCDVELLAGQVFEVTEDGQVLTKENPYGVTPGLAPDVWFREMQPKRPHWWPSNTGGGSGGSGGGGAGGSNPWSNDNWNLTEQGRYLKEHGQDKAGQMAKAAGTILGGPRPAGKK